VGVFFCVTGGSGLVGGALLERLAREGHQTLRLVRAGGSQAGSGRSALWDPATGVVAGDALEGCDGVVHLAGAGIADRRWSTSVKRELVESRVGPTRALAERIARLKRPPSVLVVASGVGFYGDPGEAWVDETSPAGQGFLAKLCVDWEAAAEPAREAGVRVVHLRLGMVVSGKGGALVRMLPVFRAGGGGPVGTGQQWVSWISLEDVLGLTLHALRDPTVSGPVNAVAPGPVRNAEFAKTLGAVLGKPAALRAPAFALRLAFGEMADALLLSGVRAKPSAALASGYGFAHESIESALRAALA
jgi:uncharacterized protein